MPKLSIVVPTHNEEHSLVRCIERVLAIAEADLELEVLVVDDASTDGTSSTRRSSRSSTLRCASSGTR